MRSTLRRLGVAIALALAILSTRPAPVRSQQFEERLVACALACLYHAFNIHCKQRSNEQCVAWYAGCVEGCLFSI